MSLLSALFINASGAGPERRFLAAASDPITAQTNKLRAILRANAATEYGRLHGFAGVSDFSDFRAKVPVADYDALAPFVRRMRDGEPNLLTAEAPVMFARTSGTTGEPKYVPITPTCQAHDHRDPLRTWLRVAQRAHPELFRGKVVSLVSPAVEGHTRGGIPYGSASGHMYRSLPRLARSTYAVPYDAFEIEDYETKYYVAMRFGVAADVTFLSSANPSSILKLCEKADEHAEAIIRDIHDGTLRADLALVPAQRATLCGGLRADASRARALQAARARRGGRLMPCDYWPRLAMVGCWKGGTVGSYLEKLPGWFDPDRARHVPVRDLGWLASEVRGSVPLEDAGAGGVLSCSTAVFEFVPAEDVDTHPAAQDRWHFLGPHEIATGREYYVFVTTTGGLYRYDMNDVLAVAGHFQQAPVVVFRRKGRGMTSITGEKVSVNQIITAFDRAGHLAHVVIEHFKAEADPHASRYVFKVECARGLASAAAQPLLSALDESLCEQNIEYEAKRRSGRLRDPILHVMKPGWYEEHKRRQVASGMRLFQAKTLLLGPTRMDEDRQHILDTVTLERPGPTATA